MTNPDFEGAFASLFEVFGKDFAPLPVSDSAWGQAYDLTTLATLAWRHRLTPALTARADALRGSLCAYQGALFDATRLGSSAEDQTQLARAAALRVLQERCLALAEPGVALREPVAGMLASLVPELAEDLSHLLTAAAELECLASTVLRGLKYRNIRERLALGPALDAGLRAVASLDDERTPREVRFAFFRAFYVASGNDALDEAEALLRGVRPVMLGEGDDVRLRGAFGSVRTFMDRGWEFAGLAFSMFDDDGRELRIDEEEQVARGLEAGLEAWAENYTIRAPRGKTSKVHALGLILRGTAALGVNTRELLAQPLTTALMTVVKVDAERGLQPIDVLRAEWIVPFVDDDALRVPPAADLAARAEIVDRVKKRVALALEREILQRGTRITLRDCFLRQRDAAGLYSLNDTEFADEERRAAYAFAGGNAEFTEYSDDSVNGITPCSGELAVWGPDGKLWGVAIVHYMRARRKVAWDRLTRENYVYIADACDDAWTSMAHALCDELGRAPDRPVMIVSNVERHPARTPKGFGVDLVKEAVRYVRLKHPYVQSVAVHVAPAQFGWADGEAVPAELELDRFEAARKLGAWAKGPVVAALADMGVGVVATLSERSVGHEAALEVLAQEAERRRLASATASRPDRA